MNTVPAILSLPTDRLRFTNDGHADPEQLLDLMVDADARRASTGLGFLAEHTRTADLPTMASDARLDPLESALLAAWNASEPEMPECHLCGSQAGPWVPDPSGDRWPSGAQKLVCMSADRQTEPVEPQPEAQPGEQPRTWSFTDRCDGERLTVTCLPGCESDHSLESLAVDVYCGIDFGQDVTLPVNDGSLEARRILSVTLRVAPFSQDESEREPRACVEVLDDEWIDNLDPDGLAAVIDTLQGRVEVLRAAHARLVTLRAEYRGQA